MNDDLLVKYLAGEAGEKEQAIVLDWVKANHDNERYFRHFRTIWEESERVALQSNVDEEAAWKRFREKVILKSPTVANVRPLSFWIRFAAIFLIVCTAGAIALSVFLSDRSVKIVRLQSGGQPVSDTLPDGSAITLNRNSRVSYPSRFTGEKRDVAMEGEAFFKVSPDKKQPFVIRVNHITVTVVGTSFNVRSRDRKTEVIVESGIVRVTKGSDQVELKAGEKVVVAGDGALTKGKNTSTLYNAYISKNFVCRNTPLPELVAALNEAYNADIIIGDRRLESMPIHAAFRNEPLDTILKVTAETFNIQVEKEGRRIILK